MRIEAEPNGVVPFSDVVGLAPADRCQATMPCTTGMKRFDRRPLSVGSGPVLSTNVDRHPDLIERDPTDHRIAAQSRDRFSSQIVPALGFSNRVFVGAVDHGVVIDHHQDRSHLPPAGAAAGDQVDYRLSGQVLVPGYAIALRGRGDRRHPPVDGVDQHLVAFRIEPSGESPHARVLIDPVPKLRCGLLRLCIAQPVIGPRRVDLASYMPVERSTDQTSTSRPTSTPSQPLPRSTSSEADTANHPKSDSRRASTESRSTTDRIYRISGEA